MSKDYKLVVLSGGNNSGKTLSTKLLAEKMGNKLTLNAHFREGLTVYQNISLLIYGRINADFVANLGKISQDVLLERTRIFYSEHISFSFYLKAVVSQIYDLNFQVLLAETEENKKIRDAENLRKYLIKFGEEAKKIDSQIWARALLSIIQNCVDKTNTTPLIIINDLRSLPEIEELTNLGKTFKVINLVRKGVENINQEVIDFCKTHPNISFTELENNNTTEDLLGSLMELINCP